MDFRAVIRVLKCWWYKVGDFGKFWVLFRDRNRAEMKKAT